MVFQKGKVLILSNVVFPLSISLAHSDMIRSGNGLTSSPKKYLSILKLFPMSTVVYYLNTPINF